MLGDGLIALCRRLAPVARPLLRQYLLRVGYVPERARWVVDRLERELTPERSTRVVGVGKGVRLEVDLASAMGRAVYYHGSHEPELVAFLRATLRPGMNVLDVGANIGEVALLAAKLVKPAGRVLAVEASPATAARLRRNVALNGASNVEIVEAAAASQTGHVSLMLGSDIDSGSTSLAEPHDFTGEVLEVKAVRLDTLLAARGLSVHLIKLDIEGAELLALEGLHAALQRAERPIVVFEYHRDVAARMGWTLEDAAERIAPHGYRLCETFGLDHSGTRMNVVARPT